MTARPIRSHPLGRCVRWAVSIGVVLVVACSGPAAGAHPGQSDPSRQPADAVACLDQRLHPADDCPAVEVEVDVEADGDDLVVRITNTGPRTWPGGPLAVEMPVTSADVDEPAGRIDPSGRPGTPEWTTRAGTVVSRCAFEPVTELRAGAELTCRLGRLGLADGVHQLWLTGFVGGLPKVQGLIGDAAPALGVVPAAATRSVQIRIRGSQVTVVPPGEPSSGARPLAMGGSTGLDPCRW